MAGKGAGGWFQTVGGYVAIAMLGLVCVLGPAVGKPLMTAPLFPLLRTAVEHLSPATFIGLGVLGLGAGLATRLPRAGIGLASIAALPLAAFAEMAADGTSHNLIPFELAMYAFMALPALLMATAARAAERRFMRDPAPPRSPEG